MGATPRRDRDRDRYFPIATTELLDAEFVTFTVLREPVDRVLSQPHRYRERVPAAGSKSLEELYENGTKGLASPNQMVKMFALTAAEIAAFATRPHGRALGARESRTRGGRPYESRCRDRSRS